MSFSCSKWTAVGMDAGGQPAASFAIKIDIYNTGARPIVLQDLILEAETHDGSRIYYEPIVLFDMKNYFSTIGQERRIATAQQGMVPLPVTISPKEHFDFNHEILFLPLDHTSIAKVPQDAPLDLRVFARSNRSKTYAEVGYQRVNVTDISQLSNGSFSGLLSTSSLLKRPDFISKRAGHKNKSKLQDRYSSTPQEPMSTNWHL